MSIRTRSQLLADLAVYIKSDGSISNTKTTGTSLRDMVRNLIDSSLLTGQGVPVGAITMWSGTIGNIPQYWRLCDGSTLGGVTVPDLRERFIVGAGGNNPNVLGSGYAVGDTGGSNNHTHNITVASHALTIQQMPLHGHPFVTATGNGNTDPGGGIAMEGNGDIVVQSPYTATPIPNPTALIGGTGGNQGHSHGATASTESGLPPYYSLAFIMFMGVPVGIDADFPDPPNPVSAFISPTQIEVNWGMGYDAYGIANYNIYLDSVLVGTVGPNTYDFIINTTITLGVIYTVEVGVVDTSGNETLSDPATVSLHLPVPTVTLDTIGIVRTQSLLQVNITASPTNLPFIDRVDIYRSTSPGGPFSFYAATPSGTVVTTYNITGLNPNTIYYFKAIARSADDGFTESAWSNLAWAATLPAPTTTTTTTNCPVEGTLVTLVDGNQVPIETLKKGDSIMSAKIDTYIDSNGAEVLNWSNSKLDVTLIPGEISEVSKHESEETISLNSGQLECSPSHTHLIKRRGYWKFLSISKVKVGDKIRAYDGEEITINKVETLKEVKTVYKLEMKSPNHIFFANGYLTHNSKPIEPDAE